MTHSTFESAVNDDVDTFGDVPTIIESKWDRSIRSYVTLLLDAGGTQYGPAMYDGTKADRDASKAIAARALAEAAIHRAATKAAEAPIARADGKPFRGYHVQTLTGESWYVSDAAPADGQPYKVDLLSVRHFGANDWRVMVIEPGTIGLPCAAGVQVTGWATREDAERAAMALLMVTDWTRTA